MLLMNQILKARALTYRQVYHTREEQKKTLSGKKKTRKKVHGVQTATETKLVEIKSVSHRSTQQ